MTAALLAVSPVTLWAQPPTNSRDLLLDMLVFSAELPIDPAAYSPPLKAEVGQHLRRSAAYHSARPAPDSLDMQVVREAEVGYERQLVAVSDDPSAPALAAAYVDGLRPCHDWEGDHGCPEAEALFADEYQAAHPHGPFSAYLPLLAAHRWLCAAEGFDRERRPEDAARSRAAYRERVSIARASPVLLIRTAADQLAARVRCFAP